MNKKFFETSKGVIINTEAIGSIAPMSAAEYKRSWDKDFSHTPYTNEELQAFGFFFDNDRAFVDYEERHLSTPRADAEKYAAAHENCYCSKKWRAGYVQIDTTSPLQLCKVKYTGDRLNCAEIVDDLYFLPKEKRDIPFVYRIHMLMPDGGMNNSHTVYTVSIADFHRLMGILNAAD